MKKGLPPNLNILSVSCGGTHTCAILQSSDQFSPGSSYVYTWGSNDSGQLGYEKDMRKGNFEPNVVSDLEGKRVIQVACGYSHTLALTVEGNVYAWGCNKYGQLGHPNIGGNVNKPFGISFFDSSEEKKVIQIAAGGRFSAALTKGPLFSLLFCVLI